MSGRERIHMLAVTWKKFSFQQMEKNFKIGFLINKSEWAMEFSSKGNNNRIFNPTGGSL